MQEILEQFGLDEPKLLTKLSVGLMNETYHVQTAQGDFILQKLHHTIPTAALEDMRVVTEYLGQNGLRVPRLKQTKIGKYWLSNNGERWRLYDRLPGHSLEAAQDAATAKSVGLLVGNMHRLLNKLSYIPQGSTPYFHDTPHILDQLKAVLARLPENAKAIAHGILQEAPKTLLLNDGGRPQIIHGDLKISNLLFDDQGRAIGIIDFDTILYRSRAIDMGDAYRSWCNKTGEDDPKANFDTELFMAAYSGYQNGWGEFQSEMPLHLQATKQIAYELAARFMIDVVHDNYFGFDTLRYPSRQLHNLARSQGQLALARSIKI